MTQEFSVQRFSVDAEGVSTSEQPAASAIDVLFDGVRVWSFDPQRDLRSSQHGWFVPWPDALLPFLDGQAQITVREHASDRTLFDEEVRIGSGEGRIFVSKKGRPAAVAKSGVITPMFAERSVDIRREFLEAMQDVLRILNDEGRVPAFLAFGCLLGAVRDRQMIGHDTDGDVAFLSTRAHPYDVARDSFRLERLVQQHGWPTRRMSAGTFKVHAALGDGSVCGIDVFAGFYVDELLHVMPVVRERLPRSALVPLSTVELEGHVFRAPADPAALLRATYGESWRVPDPAFKYSPPPRTRRRLSGWMRGLDRRELPSWNEFYERHQDPAALSAPSPFARWVHERERPTDKRLVDLGCGNGRDALWMAQQGAQVLGLDYSTVGLQLADTRATAEGLAARFMVCNLYELRHVLATGGQLAARGQCDVLYTRFLLHALHDEGRRNLWILARMALRSGGRMYLEFRTSPATTYVFGSRWRRFLDCDEVAAEIEASGGNVDYREEGTGLAVFDQEDPPVGRLVARWSEV